VSTQDCKSVYNPYDDNAFCQKRCRSNGPVQSSFLDNLNDMTPIKLNFMGPNTNFTNSNSKATPAKRCRSTLKVKIGQSPNSVRSEKSRTPRVIIPKRNLSNDRSSTGSCKNTCKKLKIKRKNPSVEKLYRIAQTEKKPKGNNAQLKRYQPLTKVYQQFSDAKDKARNYFNRDLNIVESKFIGTPEVKYYNRADEIISEEAKYSNDKKLKVEVTFGNLNEGTQREFKRVLGYNEFMKDTEVKHQEKVRFD